MRRFLRSVGLDWRFPLLAVLATALTALLASGLFFPVAIILAVSLWPLTLPAALIGWCVVFRLGEPNLPRHVRAWLAGGGAGLAAVAGMVLFAALFTENVADFLQMVPWLAVSACLSGVVSAWFLYPSAGQTRA